MMQLLKKMPLGAAMLLCVLVLTTCPHSARAEDWYQPAAADFSPVYDRDTVNKHYEAWDGGSGYWYWVQAFYKGYTKKILGITIIRQPGWTANSHLLTARIASQSVRGEAMHALNLLGRDIAGEWAKDDNHCRIGTGDLRRWGDALRRAGTHDSGTGQSIVGTIHAIQAEVNQRLAGRA